MKRIIPMLLSFAMICSLTACGNNTSNEVSLTDNGSNTPVVEIDKSLAKELKGPYINTDKTGNPSPFYIQENVADWDYKVLEATMAVIGDIYEVPFDEKVIVDNDKIKITFKGIGETGILNVGPVLEIENKTDKELLIEPFKNEVVLNNHVLIASNFYANPNETSTAVLGVECVDLFYNQIEKIETVNFKFNVKENDGNNNYTVIYESEELTFETSTATYDYKIEHEYGSELFNNGSVKLVALGNYKLASKFRDDGFIGVKLFYVENMTEDLEYTFYFADSGKAYDKNENDYLMSNNSLNHYSGVDISLKPGQSAVVRQEIELNGDEISLSEIVKYENNYGLYNNLPGKTEKKEPRENYDFSNTITFNLNLNDKEVREY